MGSRVGLRIGAIDRKWLYLVGVIALAALARVYVGLTSGFQFDDAWITYRYAQNLALGNGFVYNPGEFVEGSTAPLLVLLLALLGSAGIGMSHASLGLAVVATIGLLLCLWKIYEPRIGTGPAGIGVLLLGFSPAQIFASVSGMETALFVGLVALGFLAYVERRAILLGIAMAALLLTRIDGLVFLVAVVARELWVLGRERRLPAGAGTVVEPSPIRFVALSASTALALSLPWFAFAAFYFGDVVPNSVWAKLALYQDARIDTTPRTTIVLGILRLGLSGPAVLEVPLAALSVAALIAGGRREGLIAIWFCAYAAFFLLGPVHMHPWYFAPFHAAALIMATLCAGRWLGRLGTPSGVMGRLVRSAGIAALAAYVIFGLGQSHAKAVAYRSLYENAHIDLAGYIDEHSRPGDIVYAWDIGYIGAVSNRHILDFVGIVSPQVIAYNRRGDFVGVLKTWRPDWAIIGYYSSAYARILDDPWFAQAYALVYRNQPLGAPGWALDDPRRSTAYTWEYGVYKLR